MQNFLDVAQEIERRDLTKGGVINQNLVLSSSARVQGGSTFNGPAIFNSSATFNGGVFGAYYASSATLIPADVTATNTAWEGCHAGVSSVTIASNGGNVEVWFVGITQNSGTSQINRIYILDGQNFINGETASRPLLQFGPSPAGTTVNGGFRLLVDPKPASGSHTYCLGVSVNGGTITLNCGSSVCQFGAKEVP